MDFMCLRIVDEKGRILIPSSLREASGITKNDVVQATVCGKVIMINKVNIEPENPVEIVQREEQRKREEREALKTRMKSLLEQGMAIDEVLDEALTFML